MFCVNNNRHTSENDSLCWCIVNMSLLHSWLVVICWDNAAIVFQPAHNDKTANPEVARLMKELIKCRKQLKGQLHKHKHTHECIIAAAAAAATSLLV